MTGNMKKTVPATLTPPTMESANSCPPTRRAGTAKASPPTSALPSITSRPMWGFFCNRCPPSARRPHRVHTRPRSSHRLGIRQGTSGPRSSWAACPDEPTVTIRRRVTARHLRPRLLQTRHSVDNFTCRSEAQTAWLHRHAQQANSTGTARVLVVTEPDSSEVVAYYTWSMGAITVDDAPTRLRKGAGRYPQPVALLARLGVDPDHERRGLGAALLRDVMSRAAELGTGIGCRGLLIHAETDADRDFYLHLIPEFEPSPTDPLHLVLLMKDIQHTLRKSQT